jgi:hypothetical protein
VHTCPFVLPAHKYSCMKVREKLYQSFEIGPFTERALEFTRFCRRRENCDNRPATHVLDSYFVGFFLIRKQKRAAGAVRAGRGAILRPFTLLRLLHRRQMFQPKRTAVRSPGNDR